MQPSPPFYKGNSFIKRLVKIDGIVLKKGDTIYFHISIFSLCICVYMYVCVLFTYTISISIICVFYRTNLVLKHPSNIYTTFTAPWVWSVCFDVCLCVISNQSTSKKPHYVSGHSKLDTLLHKTHIQVPVVLRYQGLTCVDPLLSLSKIAHQMWRDHPFSQRNWATERKLGLGVVVNRGVGGGSGQNLKKGREVGNIGEFS